MKPTGRKRLGKYVLLGRLGHGGMGKIYLAYLPGPAGIEKLLVIKRLHSHLTGDEVLVGNFLDEARLSMVLSHPNIVHTYDVGEVSGRYFMVMEYIDGQNLGVVLRTAKRSGRYPKSHVWGGMFVSVLEALHAAHTAVDARGRALNIIHRDISPQNVLLTYEGVPKLVDFGIAKAAMRINETDAGVLKGKYAYMSPEQCQSDSLDPRSDIFAAGIVLWECLAGRRLYKSDSIVKSIERILHEAPIPPSRVNADCDAELSKVVVKALQKRRRDRFATAEDFRDAVDEAIRKGTHYYRASDARNLMRSLFKDVMKRQRTILDACLTSAEELADDDGQEPPAEIDTGMDSDVHVPSLGLAAPDGEPTTPSAQHKSPLVTQEESRLPGDPLPETKGSRPKTTATPQRKDRKGDTDPSKEVTVATAPPPRRRRAPLYAAILVLLLVPVCGISIAIGLDFQSNSTASLETPPTSTPNATGTGSENETAPPLTPKPETEPKGNKPPSITNPATTTETPKRTDSPVEDRRATRRRNRTRDRPRTPARTPPVPSDKRAPVDATTEIAPVVKNVEVESLPSPVTPTGTLTLETVPWTRVFLGGKFLGNTPLVNVAVPAGRQLLRLVNKQEGIEQAYEATIRAGKPTRARLGLK